MIVFWRHSVGSLLQNTYAGFSVQCRDFSPISHKRQCEDNHHHDDDDNIAILGLVLINLLNRLMMTMTQYISCVVKAHKVQTVKLTLYKYNS